MTRERWVSAAEWAVIVLLVAIDAGFAAATGIGVRRGLAYAETFALVIAIWPAMALFIRLTGIAKGGADIAEMAAKFLVFIYVATVLEYYVATSPAPLHDALLIRADRALGFDWPAVFAWFEDHRRFRDLIGLAYFHLTDEAVLVLFVTGIFYPARARSVATALIVSSLLTIPVLWVFPVAGPFVAFGHTGLPQAGYTEHYLAMRAHAMAAIPLDDPRGIVSFPSYHAAAAVLLSYLLRGIPVLFPVSLVVNAAMILGTPVLGGHYLVDVLAGLAVAGATILVIERVTGGQRIARLPLLRRPVGALHQSV
jgi:membrane-associated phospholipid phosphatase